MTTLESWENLKLLGLKIFVLNYTGEPEESIGLVEANVYEKPILTDMICAICTFEWRSIFDYGFNFSGRKKVNIECPNCGNFASRFLI